MNGTGASMGESSSGLNVAAELAGMRGEMVAGFARLEGRLDVIASSQDRTASDVDKLEKRVTALEERRWPVGMLATVSGGVSAAVAAAALFLGR